VSHVRPRQRCLGPPNPARRRCAGADADRSRAARALPRPARAASRRVRGSPLPPFRRRGRVSRQGVAGPADSARPARPARPADPPSLLLLPFVVRELASMRVLILGAYRDVDPIVGEPLSEMLATVVREPTARRIALVGLSEESVAEYVELAASELASPEFAATLHEETDGNPLFMVEAVRLLAQEGPPPDASRGGIAIPQSVRDVISRRLAHLSEECRQMLTLASVLGREFELATLGRLTGVPEDELLETLDEAMLERVLSDVPGTTGR